MSVMSANIYDFAYQKRLFGLRPNVATNPIPSNRDEILRININSIYINIDPLGNKIVQKCRTALSAVTFILPAAVSPAIFSHASIYVPVSENEGVWIEYGAYDDKRSGEFQGQVHYFQGRNGLRFAKMSIEEFNRRKSSGGTLYETIKCKVRNQMTIGNLFQAISMNDWSKYKYSLITQNCQRFVIYSIHILGAYREEFSPRGPNKITIPVGILNSLERNELISDRDTFRQLEKIPLIGPVADMIYNMREANHRDDIFDLVKI